MTTADQLRHQVSDALFRSSNDLRTVDSEAVYEDVVTTYGVIDLTTLDQHEWSRLIDRHDRSLPDDSWKP